MATLLGHTEEVIALVQMPGGHLASASDDKTVRIWDPASGLLQCCQRLHRLNSCCQHHLSHFPAATGRCVCVLQGHAGAVRALAVLPGGLLASGGEDGCLKIWVRALGYAAFDECAAT